MTKKGWFILLLLILNLWCGIVNTFIVKDYFYLILNVIAILCCADTLIGIKKRGE